MKHLVTLLALSFLSPAMSAQDPDCAGRDRFPAFAAYSALTQSFGIPGESLDKAKTTTRRISSQKIGKDLYLQVHLVNFMTKTGTSTSAIVVNEVSSQECSVSAEDVYLISNKLTSYTDTKRH